MGALLANYFTVKQFFNNQFSGKKQKNGSKILFHVHFKFPLLYELFT